MAVDVKLSTPPKGGVLSWAEIEKDNIRNIKASWEQGNRKYKNLLRRESRMRTREIIALDGEGKDLDNGNHVYTLLAAYSRTETKFLENNSISTREALDFLLSLPKAIKIAFAFDYDVNMILKDLSIKALQRLQKHHKTWWKDYLIYYIPRKQFYVKKRGKSCNIWDVFGYFQTSFNKTIHEWQVGTPEERYAIRIMKERRSGFADESRDEIRKYCILECRLLIDVFDKLLTATQECELNLARYDGAGSIASAMLRKNNIITYSQSFDSKLVDIFLRAYYGGRFDLTAYGNQGNCYGYDIRSAYPYQLVNAPCFAHGNWRLTHKYNPAVIGVWQAKWNISEAYWGPLPFRYKKNVKYYLDGEGWYWNKEIASALALYPDNITIVKGVVWDQDCEHKPFQFISEYFRQRVIYKEAGSFAQMILKLGLNSLYGKTAQSRGEYSPHYQNFAWAGWTTANTRAMMLDAIRQDPESVIFCATDGIASKKPLKLDIGKNLGQWEETKYPQLFILQNGVYSTGRLKRTRGFNPRDIDFAEIRKRARKESSFIHTFQERRFIRFGEALLYKKPLENWRNWVSVNASLEYGKYRDKNITNDRRLLAVPNPRPGTLTARFEPSILNGEGSEGSGFESWPDNF